MCVLIKGCARKYQEPDGRDETGGGRVPENFEIPEGIGFYEKVKIPENFENPATVSRTTMLYSSLRNM